MEGVLLYENNSLLERLESVRNEITSAIRKARIKNDFDVDVELSFGKIHINPRGSLSIISFDGTDVVDLDKFVVIQSLKINDNNYFDIRQEIKNNVESFYFYPIVSKGEINYTVLKSSPYFVKMFGNAIHNENIKVYYASKYLIISFYDIELKTNSTYVFLVGMFSASKTMNALLKEASKGIGIKKYLYYCYTRQRPEIFLHCGTTKQDFEGYEVLRKLDECKFYKGTVAAGFFKNCKETDNNGKIKVKATTRNAVENIIKATYQSLTNFCNLYDIDPLLLKAYFIGSTERISYKNGNEITPTRLNELANIPFIVNEENLKDKNLFVEVRYEDIPDEELW